MTTTLEQYDAVIASARALMIAKNADYGDSWRGMRATTFTDLIANKVQRIKRLEDLALKGEAPQVSEGIDSELTDILNYCVFALIQRQENK